MSGPDPSVVESALDRNVDPVSEPEAYRQMLLGLLDDRDPAEVQAQFPAQLRAMVAEAGPNLRTKPAPGEWSALEVLGHFVDAEIASGARYRWILAHDEPPLIGYDQNLWVERLHHQDGDPEEMLELLEALRRSHLQLWASSSEGDRARIGLHSERGPESFELTFRLVAGHGLYHLGQMRRTLAKVSGP